MFFHVFSYEFQVLSRDFREEKYNLSPLQLACNPVFFVFRFTMMLAPIFVLCFTYYRVIQNSTSNMFIWNEDLVFLFIRSSCSYVPACHSYLL